MLHTVCIPLWLWLDLDSWCFMMLHARSSHFISIRATNFALRCARAGTLRGLSTQFWLASCRSSSLIRSPACNSEVWQGRANAANIQFIGLIWFDMVWFCTVTVSSGYGSVQSSDEQRRQLARSSWVPWPMVQLTTGKLDESKVLMINLPKNQSHKTIGIWQSRDVESWQL